MKFNEIDDTMFRYWVREFDKDLAHNKLEHEKKVNEDFSKRFGGRPFGGTQQEIQNAYDAVEDERQTALQEGYQKIEEELFKKHFGNVEDFSPEKYRTRLKAIQKHDAGQVAEHFNRNNRPPYGGSGQENKPDRDDR